MNTLHDIGIVWEWDGEGLVLELSRSWIVGYLGIWTEPSLQFQNVICFEGTRKDVERVYRHLLKLVTAEYVAGLPDKERRSRELYDFIREYSTN